MYLSLAEQNNEVGHEAAMCTRRRRPRIERPASRENIVTGVERIDHVANLVTCVVQPCECNALSDFSRANSRQDNDEDLEEAMLMSRRSAGMHN